MKSKQNLKLSNRLYTGQIVHEDNNKFNAHIVVGSNRIGGGFNRDMNLLENYKEMVSKWKSNGLVVNKKYLRNPKGLTFDTYEEAFDALVEMESVLVKINK